jgi:hypothetical protein
MKMNSALRSVLIIVLLFSTVDLQAQEKKEVSAEELAKKLANPIASLISLPFQNNTDYGIGLHNGSRNTLNVQPVVPISLNEKLNLITRVILPIVSQRDITGEGTSQTGIGDVLASAFLSPADSKNGLTWGAGPAMLLPTATNKFLGTGKLAFGPTAVALKQSNGWTYGGLVNQLWSIAGDKSRPDLSQFFIQPFMNYNWKSGAGMGGTMEISHNWKNGSTSAVLVPNVSGVTKLGKQTVSLTIGPRIHLAGPSNAKPDFGWRAVVTLVFPK